MTTFTSLKLCVAAGLAAVVATGAAAAPVLDGGWASDELISPNTFSELSPYEFTLTESAFFRITDAGVAGDEFFVYNGAVGSGALESTGTADFSTGFGDEDMADNAWTSESFFSAEYVLTPGAYTLNIAGNITNGNSAGFFARLDSMAPMATAPVPASLPLMIAGIGVLGVSRRFFR